VTAASIIVGCILPLGIPPLFLFLKWRLDRKGCLNVDFERLLSKQLVWRVATRGVRFKLLLLLSVLLAAGGYHRVFGAPVVGLTLSLGYVVVFPLFIFWPLWTKREQMALEHQKYMVCPRCEYDLRGIGPQGTCPECGLEYTAHLLRDIWTRAMRQGLRIR